MEGTAAHAPVVSYLAEIAPDSEFTLVDIGCSGGIDEVWRRFGKRLRAIAFDPNLAEIERLQKVESHSGVRYVAGFVGLPASHSFAKRKRGRGDWGRNPWDRLSAAKSMEIMKAQSLSSAEKIAANLWPEMELANPSQVIVAPEYLRDIGIGSVDFLKIDIDGKDFDVLNSFDAALESLEVLGLGLEVNFYGSEQDTDHTFHNTDRFMKARGFELCNLTVRRYSLAVLPSRYLFSFPAQTEFGRPLQGDALYVRDLGNPEHDEFASRLGPEKLLNLICIWAAFNLPDCAAEVLVRFRRKLAPLCDVDRILDLLAAQAQAEREKPLTYREYLARFDAQDPMFFPEGSVVASKPRDGGWKPSGRAVQARLLPLIPCTLRLALRRVRRAWRVLREPYA